MRVLRELVGTAVSVGYPSDMGYTLKAAVTFLDNGGANLYVAELSLYDGVNAAFLQAGKSLGSSAASAIPLGTWDFTSATNVFGVCDAGECYALRDGYAF